MLTHDEAAFNTGISPRKMSLSCQSPTQPDWSKIRRRIEDKLRKSATEAQLREIAKLLGVKIGFGLD